MRSSVGSAAAGDVPEIERDAAEERLMIGDVLGAESVEASCRGRGQGARASRACGIGRDILVVLEIGGAGEDQGDAVGVLSTRLPSLRLEPDGAVRPPAAGDGIGRRCAPWCGAASGWRCT